MRGATPQGSVPYRWCSGAPPTRSDPQNMSEYWDVANRVDDLEEVLAEQSAIGEDQLARQSLPPFRAGSL